MSYTTKVYRDQGGDRLVVEAGGIVQLKTGGQIVGNAGDGARRHPLSAGTGTSDDIVAILLAYRSSEPILLGEDQGRRTTLGNIGIAVFAEVPACLEERLCPGLFN